ncbi:hypothetical protein LTT02_20760 [Mycolicibacterium smegmatis]|uniref:hypothetical protein n=2 Tax=Mycolicibacterium smegmatis TaxID=1772 RepID=UPI00138F197C|nr:hypothetical protein [Mycolicibacterium smegmatis]MDF1902501.1 hypothetical protein [Mycolicibacterium smegmatis]MDF1909938.1 hypothetical protein [Mycolicibacterium smegmatis]MDF1919428.1 hypothetical protein [Mycolicibacterium smegmatis]MDF1928326.1 hypothetical protein [Mycolicibacterium smegmatis]UGT73226.1 hypothetical protein LTT02_20760 [Mycolicibacterium smegmatis]
MLGGLAIVVIIGVTVAVTIFVTREGNGSTTASEISRNVGPHDVASADDDGPVSVITEDPTCMAQHPVFSEWWGEIRNGWENRDPAVPASAWTPEVRAQYEDVANAMRRASEKLAPLVKLTPHRVMRELYEQFIAYSVAYADSVPGYTGKHDPLAGVAITAADAIGNICAAIGFGSAAARGPLVPHLPAPSQIAPVDDVSDPATFLQQPNPVCSDWLATLTAFDADTAEWRATDPNIPGTEWSPEQKRINEQVTPVMNLLANQLLVLGQRSDNAIFRDFADLSSQYRQAYALALTTYAPADKHLANASIKVAGLVASACDAAVG